MKVACLCVLRALVGFGWGGGGGKRWDGVVCGCATPYVGEVVYDLKWGDGTVSDGTIDVFIEILEVVDDGTGAFEAKIRSLEAVAKAIVDVHVVAGVANL